MAKIGAGGMDGEQGRHQTRMPSGEVLPVSRFWAWVVDSLPRARRAEVAREHVTVKPGGGLAAMARQILSVPRTRALFAMGVCSEVGFAGINMILPLLVGHFAGQLVAYGGATWGQIFWLAGMIALALTFKALCNFLSVSFVDHYRAIAEVQVKRTLTAWVLGHSVQWFAEAEAGRVSHRITEIARNIWLMGGVISYELVPITVAIVLTQFIMVMIDPWAGLAFFSWVVVFVFMSWRMALVGGRFTMRQAGTRAAAAGRITDGVINHMTVRLFHGAQREDEVLERLGDREFMTHIHGATWAMVMNLSRDLWMVVLVGGMALVLGHGLLAGRIDAAGFTSGMGLMIVLMISIRSLHHIMRHMMELGGVAEDGLREISVAHQVTEKPGGGSLNVRNGHVQICNVDFGYGPHRPVFQGLDIDIPGGQRVALVGPSGAGKTSLTGLLLRLYDLDGGRILIDGQDIAQVDFASLRSAVTLIPQDTAMMHRTIMENIRYARPDASDDAVVAAARQACADEFIRELPLGYDTPVGERGVRLSGGQRQRIAIARAILRDAPVLIMDEATSALDSESEAAVQAGLAAAMEGRTVIAIAHRLSTIARLDRILVMDQGRIVEDGDHDALLAAGGLYARLWSLQSGGFLSEAAE